ncbi:ADP-ribosylglycohydrolase family protein [Arthrobacter monumenti]
MQQLPAFAARVHGCLLGGALGDALGYAVRSSSLGQASGNFRTGRHTDLSQLAAPAAFSDETQLTLFAVDGLLEALRWANDGVPADEKACLWLAYLRWLRTQDVRLPEDAPVPPPEWLDQQPVMQHRRDPDEACLTGLGSGEMGTAARPVNPDERGFGTVVRSAPFGLLPYVGPEMAYKLSTDTASLTHGHPAARQSAAAFSWIIHHIMHDGGTLASATASAVERLRREPSPEPAVLQRLEQALKLGNQAPLEPEDLNAELGTGQLAEEALAIGLYAALATETLATETAAAVAKTESASGAPETTAASEASGASEASAASDAPGAAEAHFRAAVVLSVNHEGKGDATGSITGNLLGALYGGEALPPEWLDGLEGQDVIRTMAGSLVKATSGS